MTLGPYYQGAQSPTPLEVDFYPLANADNYIRAALYFFAEDGTPITNIQGPLEDQKLVVTPPLELFNFPGLVTAQVTVLDEQYQETEVSEIQFVVLPTARDGWHTVVSAAAGFKNAPDSVELYELLEVAKQQVLAYAPALEDGAAVPVNYKRAQLLQARNLLNAGQANPNTGDQGDGSFALTIFPMDWSVQNMLRPMRGVPSVG